MDDGALRPFLHVEYSLDICLGGRILLYIELGHEHNLLRLALHHRLCSVEPVEMSLYSSKPGNGPKKKLSLSSCIVGGRIKVERAAPVFRLRSSMRMFSLRLWRTPACVIYSGQPRDTSEET